MKIDKDQQKAPILKRKVMTAVPDMNRVGLHSKNMILLEFGFEVDDDEFEITTSLALDKQRVEALIDSLTKTMKSIDNE